MGTWSGDAVLREAARRLKSAARRYDSVGRYGGEEFLIVLPGCDADDAAVQAERMREAIGGTPFLAALPASRGHRLSGRRLLLPLSSRKPWSAKPTMPSIVAKADGRNRVVVHTVKWAHAACGAP